MTSDLGIVSPFRERDQPIRATDPTQTGRHPQVGLAQDSDLSVTPKAVNQISRLGRLWILVFSIASPSLSPPATPVLVQKSSPFAPRACICTLRAFARQSFVCLCWTDPDPCLSGCCPPRAARHSLRSSYCLIAFAHRGEPRKALTFALYRVQFLPSIRARNRSRRRPRPSFDTL